MFDLFKKKKPRQIIHVDRGILVFENTSEVIQAENVLKKSGWSVQVMGPPPEIRTGCDLVVEFPLIEELNILRELESAGIPPLQIVPVTSPLLSPVNLFHTKDFGDYLMVRAANMKITVDKKNLKIVNISGGGCPDVPYLGQQLVGKTLAEAPRPRDLGHTLCGYALELAYKELCEKC
ncbi:putative Se/S carrier protein-like domain-containing protein [Candidatus Magnetomoraceae bacterium gMMP-1]